MILEKNLALFLVALALACPLPAQAQGQLDAMQAMLSRVSVRKFDQARKVTNDELRAIMDAGYRSQTLDGSTPFEFVQIRDKKTLQKIVDKSKFADWLKDSPAAIAVVVRTNESPSLYRENGSIAWMNMAYKAQELGLGTCFLGTANRRAMKEVLGIGKGRHLVTIMPVGAPKGGFAKLQSPKRHPLEWTVSQGTYGGQLNLLKGALSAKTTGKPMGAFLTGQHQEVEAFSQKAVEKNKLATALEAMRHAPSSKNKQHWRWVLVTDPKQKARIAKVAKDKTLATAPVVAVLAGCQDSRPFVNPKGWAKRRQSPYFVNHGAAMALRNLQIGLESQGLGVRVKALNSRANTRMQTLLSPKKPLSGKRVNFIAAVGMGYASKVRTRTVRPISSARIHNERYGRATVRPGRR